MNEERGSKERITKERITKERKQPLLASFDVETDGSNPLSNSLLSIGFTFHDFETKQVIQTFYCNFQGWEGKQQDPDTMKFWEKFPEQYNLLMVDRKKYKDGFKELSDLFHILSIKYRLIFIAGPSCFDWMFFKSYYEHSIFENKFPIGYACRCLSTLLSFVPKSIRINMFSQHNAGQLHYALDDALNQGNIALDVIDFLHIDPDTL